MAQTSRYSELETALIKAVFNNEELLRSLQKVFLQTPLNALDLSNLEVNFKDKVDTHKLLRKMFLPELTDNVPYEQVCDLTAFMDFKNKAYEEVVLNIKANELLIEYFEQQLKLIEKGKWQDKLAKIKLSSLLRLKGKDDTEIYVNILARNNVVNVVGGRLKNLFLLAQPEKTKEQLEEERKLNSSK